MTLEIQIRVVDPATNHIHGSVTVEVDRNELLPAGAEVALAQDILKVLEKRK